MKNYKLVVCTILRSFIVNYARKIAKVHKNPRSDNKEHVAVMLIQLWRKGRYRIPSRYPDPICMGDEKKRNPVEKFAPEARQIFAISKWLLVSFDAAG